jgi:hypothetical protein
VNVPVTDEAQAALVTQKLQEASTIRAHIGAWVVRRHAGDPFTASVLVDFTLEADTLEAAKAQAVEWAREELARGKPIEGVGEPADAGALA